MSGPVRPEPVDPLDELMKLKGQASEPDPLDELMKLKPPKHDFHAEYKSGALQKRMAGANARDAANLADEQASQPGYLERLSTHVLNAAQGIPGVEAVEAAAGALGSKLTGRPQTYRQALGTLKTATGQIGGKTGMGERILGSTAVLPFLAASPVLAGAQLGAADQALSADPDVSLAGRAGRTVLGAVGGAVFGKAAESVPTVFRVLAAKTPSANIFAREAAREAESAPLYRAALQEGQGRTGTPAIRAQLAKPDNAEIVQELQAGRPLAGVPAESPAMLDALYKTHSDRAATLRRGLDALTPNRPNIGRFRLQDTRMAQQDLLDALSGGATMPGPMPSYRPAVETFAKHSAGIDAVEQGSDALLDAVHGRLPRSKYLTRRGPEAVAEFGAEATPAERQAATEGVLGAVKHELKASPLTKGRSAFFAAPAVMRQLRSPQQLLIDELTKALLTGGNAAY